jgi:hypothetical protein
MRRPDHVVVGERVANADGDGLLADAGVQEPGEVACAEALLDLLLEPPDQQHLGQERDELLAGEALPGGHRYAPAIRSTRSTRRQL